MTCVEVEVRKASPLTEPAASLVAQLDAEIQGRYGEPLGLDLSIDAEEVEDGLGAFALAWVAGAAVGCGAVRLIESDKVELKRMFVVPEFRRQGAAKALLQFLEGEAAALGARMVVLETVATPPDAVALYRAAGYFQIPNFGPYINSQISYCMRKRLDGGG